jgi:hypothetical protein
MRKTIAAIALTPVTGLVARLYSYRNATIGSTFVARRAGR